MRFVRTALFGLWAVTCLLTIQAGEYKMANGNTLRGEIVSADEDGLVVKLDVGGFSSRQPWVGLSQETLRELRGNPEYREFVELFIEKTDEELEREYRRQEPVIREAANRVERPTPRPGLLTAFVSPIGLLILGLLYGGNLYAGYEIARYRLRPVPLVVGLSALVPLVGPLIILALPTALPEAVEEVPADDLAGSSMAVPTHAADRAGGLSLAATEKTGTASAASQPQVFQRGEHTFNRRFFESKFPGFFRVVLGDAERDLVLVFRTPKQEYVGRRISRISMNELHLVLLSNSKETSIPFGEITTVILKHKDAKV